MRTPIAQVSTGRLPNFLIIGAMKAGTTSLYHYVREHPQVFMPAYKAPEFFAGGSHWDRGIDWYRNQFALAPPHAVAVGEASNAYAKYPHHPGVPQRIAAYIPEARLIYIVRDPIERIRSHYQTRVADGSEKEPFEKAVLDKPLYLNLSRYALQLEQYFEYFPREQLLIITSEDLRRARRPTIRKVYEFLGVEADFVPPNLERDYYRTDDRAGRSPIPLWVRKRLKTHFPASKRFKELENNVLGPLKQRLRGRAAEGADPGGSLVLSKEVRAELASLLTPDVRLLRSYLGPEFDGWGLV